MQDEPRRSAPRRPAGVSHAQDRKTCEQTYKPQVGQSGKDVVWVPTPDELVQRMLRMAKVTPQDTVYDLGAGDGKIAIAATIRGFMGRFMYMPSARCSR